MGVFEQLNSGQSPPTTGGGVFGRLKSDFQQRQLNQDLNDKQQMDQASAISDSMPPSTPTWNGLLDNPITHGVETGLSWAAKPFETVSTGLADTVGAVNNLLGSEKRTGFDGKEYVSTPSESRNFLDDVKSIWSQTNSDTSSKAWQGVFPNLGKMKGTDTNWTDVLDFGAQAAIPLDVAPLLKAAKLGSEGLLGARLAGEAGNVIAKEPSALNAANNAAGGIFAQAAERPSLGSAVDEFTNRVNSERPSMQASEGPSYSGVNLQSKADQPLPVSEPVNAETMKGNWFTNLFGEQNIGITPFGSNKSNKMVSTEQQIVNNPLKQSVDGLLDSTKQLGRSTYQNTVDYLSPLKNITKETYNTAMDSSRANNLANTIIRDKFVDNQGNVIGSSLNDIMKSVSGLGKKFDDYLILRHAETRMNRGERVYDDSLNMTPQKARKAAATLESRYPQLQQAGAEWDKFNTNMLDSGVNEGLISQSARDAMRSENPNYASMRRQFTIGEKLSQPKWGSGGSSFSGQSAPIKEVSPTGSTRKIVSPIRSAVEQAYAWKNAELRNRTMQEITKAIQSDPEGMRGIAEIVKKPSTSYNSLDNALRQGGSEEFLQQLDNDFKSLFKPAKTGDENIVRAMIDGNPVYIKVHNAESVKALLGMGSDQSGIILQAMQKLSNATKRGATGLLAPMFAVKNLTADTVQAAIQSPNAFKHVAVDLPHAVISSIADIFKIPGLNHLAEDFRRSGGEYSALLRGDRGLNKSVFDLRKVAPLSPEGVMKGAISTVKAPFKALEKVADVTENVNRMAAFRRAMMGKERTPENVRNAINAARESTTNFSRKGAFSREVEAFVPYSNAAVQGIYRTGNAFYKNPVKTTAGVGTLVIAPKLYEYAKFNNDPDYQKLPARERYRNLIIRKNDDGTFTKVPMPPEYSALGAFVTDVLNDVVNHDPQAYKGTLDALANAFTPPFVSGLLQGATQGGGPEKSIAGALNATVAAPFVATVANQSFTGAPIVSKAVADRSPEYQYDEKTSNIAKTIGQVAGMSPMKVDYLIRAYGGDPARLLLPLNSPVGAGNTRNTLLKNFIVDPQLTNTLTNDFYTSKQKLDQAYKDNKEAGAPLPSWYSEDLRKQMDSQGRGSINKQLSDLTTQKKTINADANLPAEQKSAKLRAIQGQMNDIYMDINSKLYKQGVPIK